jgi:hypothetical protein
MVLFLSVECVTIDVVRLIGPHVHRGAL